MRFLLSCCSILVIAPASAQAEAFFTGLGELPGGRFASRARALTIDADEGPVVVGVSISAADASTGHPHAKDFMNFAFEGLSKSFDTGIITVRPYDPTLALSV